MVVKLVICLINQVIGYILDAKATSQLIEKAQPATKKPTSQVSSSPKLQTGKILQSNTSNSTCKSW